MKIKAYICAIVKQIEVGATYKPQKIMNEEYVTFEIAKKLKDLGFNEPFFFYYREDDKEKYVHHANISKPLIYCDKIDNEVIIAPTIAQVLKWLREVKKIFIAINIGYCYESYEKPFPTNPKMEPILKGYYYGVWDLGNLNDENACSEYFDSYEQAAITGIEYTLYNLI